MHIAPKVPSYLYRTQLIFYAYCEYMALVGITTADVDKFYGLLEAIVVGDSDLIF